MKVLMLPHVSEIQGQSNGIARVVEGYFKHLPQFDIELVEPNATSYDLVAAHAGITGGQCTVAMLHGLYFTSDYNASEWEWHVNSRVIEACRNAKIITVPSAWVAEVFQRDMRINPFVIPHGIDWEEWQHNEENEGFCLWGKNRRFDVNDNSILDVLVNHFPNVPFVSTLVTPSLDGKPFPMWPKNFKILESGGKTPPAEMKGYIQRAGVYLSLSKETFGIQCLEAMSSGVPILGWAWGGNLDLVQTGVNGYLAKPGDVDDLCEGLNYCLKHRKVLGANGRELAKAWTWAKSCELVAGVYRLAMEEQPASVSVVIPCYNKENTIERAIESVINQTYPVDQIIIIDDGSTDGSAERIERYRQKVGDNRIALKGQSNQGVSVARNSGITLSSSRYITCLDGDDWLEPTFLEVCINALEKDRSLGIAYTGLRAHNADGSNVISDWPGQFNPDKQLSYPKQNQIPTSCVFRRDAWERVGGYKSRYAPDGSGSEDAALWSAICSIGYNAKKVTDEALFNYTAFGGNVHGNREYVEVDWLSMMPWAKDNQHPFASVATPKRWSHPVRQYDSPAISVIIPVGPGHEKEVINALDSLEMQHFRKWEAIVVWDGPGFAENETVKQIQKSYPYARCFTVSAWEQDKGYGAGWARNFGAKFARAPLLLFLDADDVLADPHALDKMLQAWNAHEAIIYSDYLGKAVWDYEQASKEFGDRLLHYHHKSQTAIFRKHAADYDCSLAQRQPELSSNPTMPYYHWCLVSVLVPKAWHDKIGGFDETMATWEDVDYMWRLARNGYCFERVAEPLVMYSYHKGYRREKSAVTDEVSLQNHRSLIQYIKQKYEGLKPVGCGCGGKRQQQATVVGEAANGMNDQEFVMIEFDFAGSETRETYGKTLKSVTGQKDLQSKVLDYKGYSRRKGDRFLVHVRDQQARPDMFRLVPNEVKAPEVETRPLAEPVLIAKRRGRREAVAMAGERGEVTVKVLLAATTIAIAVFFIAYFAALILGYAELADRIGWRLLAPIPLWYFLALFGGMIAEILAQKQNKH